MLRLNRHARTDSTLPTPQVGDPFPAGASDDVDCPEPGCRREPGHPAPHVSAHDGRVSGTWSTATRRVGLGLAALAVGAVALAGCSQPPTQQDLDSQASQDNINKLVARQPVAAGKYSPTREQINNWNRTWQSGPGKLAYVYLFNQGQSQPVGYYVLSGPPVSYAANATQTESAQCQENAGCPVLPNAGQDGAFYNAGSGTNQFYGMDATTHRELEWGGTGVWYLLSDQPLRLTAPPLGDTVAPAAK